MELKPQDSVIALKYWSLVKDGIDLSVREIADQIGISAGEVSKGTKRLIGARLLVERDRKIFAESGALFEWLGYGVRYAYPAESIGYGRGMPTSWNSPMVHSEVSPPSPPIVWPVPSGDVEGMQINPIHDSVALACSNDKRVYHAFSLIEAIRMGKPRELEIARRLLSELIRGK